VGYRIIVPQAHDDLIYTAMLTWTMFIHVQKRDG
jgi:hypothetical protein